jgi:hypothetical protein
LPVQRARRSPIDRRAVSSAIAARRNPFEIRRHPALSP